MNTNETLKLALEAIEAHNSGDWDTASELFDEAIPALREALAEQPAQPQQEPVAFGYVKPGEGDYEKAFSWNYNERNGYTQPIYTSPPAPRKPLTDEQRTSLRDAFAQALTSVYVCGRVWEAWQYGTMSEGDFQPAGECEEVLDSLIEAAHGIGEKK